MGGLIIILGILVPTLLFCKLDNIYIIMMLTTTVWLGAIGFLDDYIKVFKKNKEGLAGKFKITGQVGLALFIGFTMYNNKNIIIRGNRFDANFQGEMQIEWADGVTIAAPDGFIATIRQGFSTAWIVKTGANAWASCRKSGHAGDSQSQFTMKRIVA